MEAKSIRIIAPIPGKAAVGIEVPNPQPQEVALKKCCKPISRARKISYPCLAWQSCQWRLCHERSGKNAPLHHCRGNRIGKIGLHQHHRHVHSDECQTRRNQTDHGRPQKSGTDSLHPPPPMLAPVITEPQGACAALNWLVKEMENRYEILKLVGVRNIEAFNTEKSIKNSKQSLDREIPIRMPYHRRHHR